MQQETNSGPALVLRVWPESGMADMVMAPDAGFTPTNVADLLRDVAASIEGGRLGVVQQGDLDL